MEDIIFLMNTISRMVLSGYLGYTDESLVELTNERDKFKIAK